MILIFIDYFEFFWGVCEIGWCNMYWFVNIYVYVCLVFNVIEWIVSDFYKNKSVYVCILFDIYVVWFSKLIFI